MIRVQVWARSAITRAGLEAIVEADTRFAVVRKGSRDPGYDPGFDPGFDPGLRISSDRPAVDVLLLDNPEDPAARLAARPLAARLQDQAGAPCIVALVDGENRREVLLLLQAGVRAVIPREASPHEITAALQAASDGLAVISPELLDLLLPAPHGRHDAEEAPLEEPLTAREQEVLALLAAGAGNREIAARLQISEHTAKFHVSSILGKLGAASRTEAVARGYRSGLILI